MGEIDLRDGKADGKMTRSDTDCFQCGRRLGKRRRNCLYCGANLIKPLGLKSDT